MHADSTNPIRFNDFVATLLAHPRRWLIPTTVVLIVALCYALLSKPKWEATQSLLVRNEATASGTQLGKFEGLDAMKNAQETLLEIATSRSVASAALTSVHDTDSPARVYVPSQREIDQTIGRIQIRAPHGVEFGRSEVIRLIYADTDRQRAIDLNRAIGLELERHMQELRDRKAESLVAELGKAVDLARVDLAEATVRLASLEATVGEDLAELRSLADSAGSTSNLRTRQTHLENELRQATLAQQESKQLMATLIEMENDPNRLLATPTALLQSQPILQRLKEGLTAAQLQTASLNGSMSDVHPLVIAARQAEAEVHSRVRNELATAISGMRMEGELQHSRAQTLAQQLGEVRSRMQRIAGLRAQYQNLVLEVRDRNEILKSAQQQQAAARSSQASALSTSMLTRIGSPATGSYASGPRKAYIVLAGLIGGLACGLGVVFLTTKAGAAQHYLFGKRTDTVDRKTSHVHASPAAEPSLADLAATIQPKLGGLPQRAADWRAIFYRFSRITPSDN